jgi:hypothetical protein
MQSVESTGRESSEQRALHPTWKTNLHGTADDSRWQLVQRIVSSRSLGRSPLLSSFLLYVCDRHLRGKASEITEQQIGVHVFGRMEGYNSNDDNIVRNYARTLRKRMEDYFASEGQDEELRVDIPRGAYIPVFTLKQGERARPEREGADEQETSQAFAPPTAQPAIALPEAPAIPLLAESSIQQQALRPAAALVSRIPGRRGLILYIGVGLFVTMIVAMAASLLSPRLPAMFSKSATHVSQEVQLNHALWGQIFQNERDTFIVPADAGLVIMQTLTQHPVSLAEYASGSYRTVTPGPGGLNAYATEELGQRRYTSVVDLNFVFRLAQVKEAVPGRMLIRYARDLRFDDLRSGNAILMGSPDANPWVELFQPQLNFRFSFNPKQDPAPLIVNKHPLPGESAIYSRNAKDPTYATYGVIAYVPNLDGTGHVLIVEGINMAGTQAAGTFLLNPSLMRPTLEHARGPHGSIRSFEILIQTLSVAANASRPQVISERIAPI